MELKIVALGVLFNFNNARVFRNINIFILSNIFCNINIIVIHNLWDFFLIVYYSRIFWQDNIFRGFVTFRQKRLHSIPEIWVIFLTLCLYIICHGWPSQFNTVISLFFYNLSMYCCFYFSRISYTFVFFSKFLSWDGYSWKEVDQA